MNCPYCNNINNNPSASVCEFCGAPLPIQAAPQADTQHNPQADYQQPQYQQNTYQQNAYQQNAYQQNAYQQNAYQQTNQYNQNYATGYAPTPYSRPGITCPTCGNICDFKAAICVRCGTKLNTGVNDANDVPSLGLQILSFFFPIVGIILYAVKNSTEPKSAKSYGKIALISFILNIVFTVLIYILSFVGVFFMSY